MTTSVETIFASIVADRGGASNFDQTQLHIARRVAQMLADEGDLSPTALSALLALLPDKPSADAPEYDLSRLTDREFAALDKLCAKVADVTLPPAPEAEPRVRRRSPRERAAAELALLLDALEGEQDAARKANWRNVPPASDTDVQHVQNCITSLLGLVTWPRVAEPWIENAVFTERKLWLDREAAELAARAAEVPIAPTAEPAPAEPAPEARVLPFIFRAPRSPLPGTI